MAKSKSKSELTIEWAGLTKEQVDLFVDAGLTLIQIANVIKKYRTKQAKMMLFGNPNPEDVFKAIKKVMGPKVKANAARDWLKTRLGSSTAEIPVYELIHNFGTPYDTTQILNLIFPIPMSVNHMYQVNPVTGGKMMTAEAKVMQIQMQDTVIDEVRIQGWTPVYNTKVIVEMTAFYPDNRKRDLDNMFKMTGDALKGIALDDDYYLLPRVMDFTVDKGYARLEVKVYIK